MDFLETRGHSPDSTSPRLRGEVGGRSPTGEGDWPKSSLPEAAPHPTPLSRRRMFPTSTDSIKARNRVNPISGAGGERERTEPAAAFILTT